MAITAEKVQILVEAEVSKALDNLKKTDTQTSKLTAAFKKLAGPVAIGAAIAGFIKLGKASVDAFVIQEQAEAKLNQTIKATGAVAGLTADQLTDMASSLQGVTKYGDEAIIGAESLLLTFKEIGGDTFPRALESILDVSEAMGQDLKSSTVQLGKALNDPVGGLAALTRVGIQFTDAQKDLIKEMASTNDVAGAQSVILDELESQFGGIARAAADTNSGGMVQFKNALGDVAEAGGKVISDFADPYIRKLTEILSKQAEFANEQDRLRDITLIYVELRDEIEATGQATGNLSELQVKLAAAESKVQTAKGRDKTLAMEYVVVLQDQIAVQEEFMRSINELRKTQSDQAAGQSDLTDEIDEDLAALQEAYAKTDQAQIEALASQIAYFEGFVQDPMAVAVLESLRAEYASLTETAETGLTTIADLEAEYNEGSIQDWLRGNAEKLRITEETEQAIRDEAEETAALQKSVAGDLYSGLKSVTSAYYDTKLSLYDKDSEEYKAIQKQQFEANKRAAIIDIGISTAVAAVKALELGVPLGPIASAGIIALGAAQAGLVAQQQAPAFATGGDFVTTGPQMIMVGDNPGGQERVQVTPIGSPNINGPSGGKIVLEFMPRGIVKPVQTLIDNQEIIIR